MLPQPLLAIILQALTSTLIIGFTTPNSVVRFGAFAVIAFCTWQCMLGSRSYFENRAWATTLTGYATQLFFHYVDVALIRKLSFDNRARAVSQTALDGSVVMSGIHARPNKDQNQTKWIEKLMFGLSLTFTCRFIGTPDQIRFIPPFLRADPSFIPTRRRFLQEALATIVFCYIAIRLIQLDIGTSIDMRYVSLQHIPVFRRLREVSGEEIFARLAVCVKLLVNINLTQRALYGLIGFLAVLLGISEPWQWPPFYGSFSEAFTIRRVWSRFWHQSNTHKFQTISTFIAHEVFRMPRQMLATRYLKNVVVFVISGLMHIPIDIATGISVYESGAMACFSAQMVGLFAEDFVVGLYSKFVTLSGRRLPSVLEKAIGYTWTTAFFVWSVPAYVYPKLIPREVR